MQDRRGADPRRRMRRFFETLYSCLTRGGRAVLQIYPADSSQAEMLTSAAMRAGFSGGLVVDFPHSTRAKKYFLVLMVGGSTAMPAPRGLSGEASDEEDGTVAVAGRQHSGKRRKLGAAGAGVSAQNFFDPGCTTALDDSPDLATIIDDVAKPVAFAQISLYICELLCDFNSHGVHRVPADIQKARGKHGF